jgi:hypothetical protein
MGIPANCNSLALFPKRVDFTEEELAQIRSMFRACHVGQLFLPGMDRAEAAPSWELHGCGPFGFDAKVED